MDLAPALPYSLLQNVSPAALVAGITVNSIKGGATYKCDDADCSDEADMSTTIREYKKLKAALPSVRKPFDDVKTLSPLDPTCARKQHLKPDQKAASGKH
ncbi:MAG: hypothetical protein C5B49_11665 [Bdellovibrio sp.]|nr:MAG: hypothetical protein C5B49_11665 [Bdellovibrio sp.]